MSLVNKFVGLFANGNFNRENEEIMGEFESPENEGQEQSFDDNSVTTTNVYTVGSTDNASVNEPAAPTANEAVFRANIKNIRDFVEYKDENRDLVIDLLRKGNIVYVSFQLLHSKCQNMENGADEFNRITSSYYYSFCGAASALYATVEKIEPFCFQIAPKDVGIETISYEDEE